MKQTIVDCKIDGGKVAVRVKDGLNRHRLLLSLVSSTVSFPLAGGKCTVSTYISRHQTPEHLSASFINVFGSACAWVKASV